MKKQKLIVGLGNGVEKYAGTRHNFGFDVIDRFNEKYNLNYDRMNTTAWISRSKRSSYLRKKLETQAVLGKPISYMNTSGPKIKKLLEKLGANIKDLLIIYDDIDLDLGRVRIRPSGSAGGHKGMRSIIRSLGTDGFARLKLGIGPQGDLNSEDFVLQKFSKTEKDLKKKVTDGAVEAIIDFCNNSIDELMSKYNGIDYNQKTVRNKNKEL
ncbi:MAG: aminoacyl-tRNA hydrolase [Candidatus Marinimicrobia bacterium]|nr:aminoacyl-tRNA hydrolase [Candidatus Neomarinimicrobiota bacterium]